MVDLGLSLRFQITINIEFDMFETLFSVVVLMRVFLCWRWSWNGGSGSGMGCDGGSGSGVYRQVGGLGRGVVVVYGKVYIG